MKEAWRACVAAMLADLERGSPRAQAYWAQQLAFAPVFPHAVALYLREAGLGEPARDALRAVVELALSGLAALPEIRGASPADLARLAARQARVLTTGRRRRLERLYERLVPGTPVPATDYVPERMLRAYPLLGWSPPAASGPGAPC